MKNVSIVVIGRVQGVFFRASAKETAEQLNIKGFAQNKPDGSVYIEAEGEEENLTRFVAWCSQGPPRADVINLQVDSGAVKNYTTFEIRR